MSEHPIQKCVPELGVYCMPLARRVRGVINQMPHGGLGIIQRLTVNNEGQLTPEFLGIAYKVPGTLDPGIVLNFCMFCGSSIRRDNPGHPPPEDLATA